MDITSPLKIFLAPRLLHWVKSDGDALSSILLRSGLKVNYPLKTHFSCFGVAQKIFRDHYDSKNVFKKFFEELSFP